MKPCSVLWIPFHCITKDGDFVSALGNTWSLCVRPNVFCVLSHLAHFPCMIIYFTEFVYF